MRRTGTWLCLVVMLAAGAATMPTAWAAGLEGIPEFGRCVAAAPHTGEYRGAKCLAPAAGKGNYNWEPGPGPKPKFEGLLSTLKLETVGKKFTMSCSFGVVTGEYKTPKTASVTIETQGCLRMTGPETFQKCQLTTLEEGELKLTFEAELGFIKGGERPKVGLDLKPTQPIVFTCGVFPEVPLTAVTVEGSAIGEIRPPNSMRETVKLSYLAPGGKQGPESFEGQPKDTLTLSALTGAETLTEQAGLTIIDVEEKPKPLVIENEEPIEVKAKYALNACRAARGRRPAPLAMQYQLAPLVA